MKKIVKCYVNYFWFGLALSAALFSGCSCSAPKAISDPLASVHIAALYTPDTNKAVTDDYKDYIQKLSPDERTHIAGIEFFEDGTGQHAVKITIGLGRTDWEHILIYDKGDKRIKTIKYVSGHSYS